jgi:hypothetical protein
MSADPLDRESPSDRRARIFVRQRQRRRRLLAAAGVLIVIGAGGGFWAMRRVLLPGATSVEVPLIRADDEPTRKRPAEPGGISVPDQDSLVLNRSEPKVERLLPPPETPVARPARAPAPEARPPASGAASPVVASTAPVPTVLAPPPASDAGPAPTAPASEAPASTGPPAAADHTAKVAALPPAAAAASTTLPPGKGYRLQLGSVRSPEAAKQEWQRLQQKNRDVLGSLGFATVRADLGERGIYYRIQAGPLADAASGQRVCEALKQRGLGCLLVKQ